jgi:protoheme IX farnesyltransferase
MEPRRRLEDWHHMLAMCLVMAVVAGGLAYLFLHIDFIPNPASVERGLIDSFIQLLFAIASVFFAVIVTVFAYALLFFRRQRGDDSDARPIRGKASLELSWTFIPLIIVIVLSFHGAKVLDKMSASNHSHSTAQSVYSLGAFVPGELATSNTSEKELVVNITAAAAMFLAAKGAPPAATLLFTLLGGGCVAAAANTFNSYLDRDIDALMARTRHRLLPSGRVRPNHALAFGTSIGLIGVLILSGFVNWAAAMLAVVALVYYILPYTLWLKRRTYWSAIIGSGIGAIPPLIGWAAVTHRIELTPFLLSAIIILWTLPHFWTLAIFRRSDYEQAGLRILPEKGVASWIIACSSLLVATTLFLVPAADLGLFYLGTACFLGVGFLYLALRMNHGEPLRTAWHLYGYSIFTYRSCSGQ